MVNSQHVVPVQFHEGVEPEAAPGAPHQAKYENVQLKTGLRLEGVFVLSSYLSMKSEARVQ